MKGRTIVQITEIFTEYDSSLSKNLNIDPLGFQIVWTHFGQKIFENKVTSVALDIRSYNINIFNHFIIYKLIREDRDNSDISSSILKLLNNRTGIEKLLVIMENMLTWSWFITKESWSEDEKRGLLGTSKALSKWRGKTQLELHVNQELKNIEVLKNQKSLGVSGRYKGPFIRMGFFDTYYSTNSYKNAEELFSEVENLFFSNNLVKTLYLQVIDYFKEYDRTHVISSDLVDAFKNTFQNKKTINSTMKSFWMKHLGLEESEAQVLYEQINLDEKRPNIKFIFQNIELQTQKIKDILNIEPKLAYLQLLFEYLLLQDDCKVSKLPLNYIEVLNDIEWIDTDRDSSAQYRIQKIKKIKDYKSFINYHKEIMKLRGQFPWIEIIDETIKVKLFRNNTLQDVEDELKKGIDNIEWIHDYYISSIKNIKQGLES